MKEYSSKFIKLLTNYSYSRKASFAREMVNQWKFWVLQILGNTWLEVHRISIRSSEHVWSLQKIFCLYDPNIEVTKTIRKLTWYTMEFARFTWVTRAPLQLTSKFARMITRLKSRLRHSGMRRRCWVAIENFSPCLKTFRYTRYFHCFVQWKILLFIYASVISTKLSSLLKLLFMKANTFAIHLVGYLFSISDG